MVSVMEKKDRDFKITILVKILVQIGLYYNQIEDNNNILRGMFSNF